MHQIKHERSLKRGRKEHLTIFGFCQLDFYLLIVMLFQYAAINSYFSKGAATGRYTQWMHRK